MNNHRDIKAKVLNAIDNSKLIELLRDMIKIRSFSYEERPLAEFLASQISEIGLDVKLQEMGKNSSNVIGTFKGKGNGPSLMLNGHLDMNPPVEGWTRDPYGAQIEEGWIYGIGAHHMKSGLAAMIAAVEALKKTGIKPRGDIVLAGVVGELQGGLGTKHLIKEGLTTDFAVVGEPTGNNISTVHCGVLQARISVIGKAAHIMIIEQGVNAVENMYRVIDVLKKTEFRYKENPLYRGLPRMNIGTIKGGISREYIDLRPSIVPDFCTITIDVRTVPGQTPERVIEDIQKTLQRVEISHPEIRTEIQPLKPPSFSSMPPFEISPEEYIVKVFRKAHRYVTGKEPAIGALEPIKFGGTDANHLLKVGVPSVVYGPGKLELLGKYADERGEIAEIVTASKVYATAALDVCMSKRVSTN